MAFYFVSNSFLTFLVNLSCIDDILCLCFQNPTQVIELISHLNTVREEYLTVDSQSQVDDTLDDVFQLLSLFFMALGKTKDSAASYVQLATIKVN